MKTLLDDRVGGLFPIIPFVSEFRLSALVPIDRVFSRSSNCVMAAAVESREFIGASAAARPALGRITYI